MHHPLQLLEHSDSSALLASETGNGKTLALVVPMLQGLLDVREAEEVMREEREGREAPRVPTNSPTAVIVTPGRELADQVKTLAMLD